MNLSSNPLSISPDYMVLVKGGAFQIRENIVKYKVKIGSLEKAVSQPQQVTLNDFLIAKHQLTFEEFDAFCKATSRDLPNDEGWGRGKWPVINVSWFDAIDYCNWRSQQEGLMEVYRINQQEVIANWNANGYRLATEAEWEYAARGGQQSHGFDYAGSNLVDEVAWYQDNSGGKTHPVGEKKANELGIYDLSGNVWEWCWDWHGDDYLTDPTNPKGPDTGSRRISRGGSWSNGAVFSNIVLRYSFSPDIWSNWIGFRLARTVPVI